MKNCRLILLALPFLHSLWQAESAFGQAASSQQNNDILRFTPNKGQIKDEQNKIQNDILYSGSSSGLAVFIRETGISYRVEENKPRPSTLYHQADPNSGNPFESDQTKFYQMNVCFVGANNAPITGLKPYSSVVNFVSGSEVYTGLSEFPELLQRGIYPDIDLHYYGKHAGLEYDFIVQPGGNPNQILLKWTGPELMMLKSDGSLIIQTIFGELKEVIPSVYQVIDGQRREIKASFQLRKRGVSYFIAYSLGKYDNRYSLIIDPYISFYGGEDSDYAAHVATDASGNVFLTGTTQSKTNIAKNGWSNVFSGGFDGFLVKFNSKGQRLWATYFGGSASDNPTDLHIASDGSIYVACHTRSVNLGYNAHQTDFGGTVDGLLIKFTAAGTRAWASYYGGGSDDAITGVCTDYNGDVFISGYSRSLIAIATASSHQDTLKGTTRTDAFVAKFDKDGNRYWGTYIGSESDDYGMGCCTDSKGDVFITGSTFGNSGFHKNGMYSSNSGGRDAFISKFTGFGVLIWSTFFGGDRDDLFEAIVCDTDDNVIASGSTQSTNKVAFNAFQDSIASWGPRDVLLSKFHKNGTIIWSTYYGGKSEDYSKGVAIDPANNHIFISGDTYSDNFPTSTCAVQKVKYGKENSFLVHFTDEGEVVCASYFGREHEEDATVAVHGCFAYLAGYTPDTVPTTSNAHQTTSGGKQDLFIAQLYKNTCGLYIPELSYEIETTSSSYCDARCDGSAIIDFHAFSVCLNSGDIYAILSSGDTIYGLTDSTLVLTGLCPGEHWVQFNTDCEIVDTLFFEIESPKEILAQLDLIRDTLICWGDSHKFQSPVPADAFLWQDMSVADSFLTDLEGLYWLEIRIDSCFLRDTAFLSVDTSVYNLDLGIDFPLCKGDTFTLKYDSQEVLEYSWNTGSTESRIYVTDSGWYSLNVSSGHCENSDSIYIGLIIPLEFDLGPDTIFCSEYGTVLVMPDLDASFSWGDGSTGDSLFIEESGKYQLTGTALCGSYTDEIELTKVNCINCQFFIPNAFSPNNDGHNDLFVPVPRCPVTDYHILIYNRWGEQVFMSDDYDYQWDGNFLGKECQMGVYVYLISCTFLDGTLGLASGEIHLIR